LLPVGDHRRRRRAVVDLPLRLRPNNTLDSLHLHRKININININIERKTTMKASTTIVATREDWA
jgi:hypothetical protein